MQVIRNNEEINQLINDHPAMVYLNPKVALAKTKVPRIYSVRECEAEVEFFSEFVSSAVYIRWVNQLLFLFQKHFNKKYILQYIHYLVFTTRYQCFILGLHKQSWGSHMVFATTSKQAGPQWRCVALSGTTGLWKQLPKDCPVCQVPEASYSVFFIMC